MRQTCIRFAAAKADTVLCLCIYWQEVVEMCPNQLVTTITAFAVALSEGKTSEEISVLAAILVQLGDTLATIATQKTFCNK